MTLINKIRSLFRTPKSPPTALGSSKWHLSPKWQHVKFFGSDVHLSNIDHRLSK